MHYITSEILNKEVAQNFRSFLMFNLRRCVKAFIILILTVICIYFTYEIYIDFASHPISVKIADRVEQGASLPDVMICPLDSFNITQLKLDGFSNDAISAFHWHIVQDLYNQHGASDSLDFHTVFEITNVTKIIERNDWASFVKYYSLSCSSLLVQCNFMYVQFDCCKLAQATFHEKHGICYKFPYNSYPMNSKISRSGGDAGLVLILNVPEFDNSGISLAALEAGLSLEYAEALTPPFTTGGYPTVRLAINTSIDISLFRTLYQRVNESTSPCANNTHDCRLLCIHNYVQEFCNCNLLGFTADQDNITSLRVCNPVDVSNCFKKSAYQIYYQKTCLTIKCDTPCREWTYSPQVTYGNLNKKTWEIGNSSLSRDVIKVRVFYSTLRYTEIIEFNILSFDFLLSQLGGMIGLWLGASIFTVAKIIDKIWRWFEGKQFKVKTQPNVNIV